MCRVETASPIPQRLKDTPRGIALFWWRKRSEGFEWRDYVRTTILVRREERRQRIKDVQGAAAAHVKDAGAHVKHAGRRGLDAAVAGSRVAATGSWSGLKKTGAALANAARWTGHAALRAVVVAGGALAAATAALASGLSAMARGATNPLLPVLEPVLSFARQPKPNLVLKVVAGLAGLGAAYRTWAFGFDGDAKMAAFVSVVAAILVGLAALTDPDRRRREHGLLARLNDYEVLFPGGRRMSLGAAALGVLALVGVSAAGVAAIGHLSAPSPSAPGTASVPMPKPKSTATAAPAGDPATITSRQARAVTGDLLKIGSTLVALDGIEAPETAQSCERESGRWRCGTASRDALARLVRGRSVSCEITGERKDGIKTGTCATGDTDLAEKLIEEGMAFSTSFFFWSRYARLENKARTEKNGLWAGEADRPQVWRDKRWAEAKEKAPDGCPIKGRIRSGARVYVLPWSAAYDSVRLRSARGERWFCSETEAEAAGWRRAEPS